MRFKIGDNVYVYRTPSFQEKRDLSKIDGFYWVDYGFKKYGTIVEIWEYPFSRCLIDFGGYEWSYPMSYLINSRKAKIERLLNE